MASQQPKVYLAPKREQCDATGALPLDRLAKFPQFRFPAGKITHFQWNPMINARKNSNVKECEKQIIFGKKYMGVNESFL